MPDCEPRLYRPGMNVDKTADDETFILLARCRACINIESCGCCWSRMNPKFRGFSDDRCGKRVIRSTLPAMRKQRRRWLSKQSTTCWWWTLVFRMRMESA